MSTKAISRLQQKLKNELQIARDDTQQQRLKNAITIAKLEIVTAILEED